MYLTDKTKEVLFLDRQKCKKCVFFINSENASLCYFQVMKGVVTSFDQADSVSGKLCGQWLSTTVYNTTNEDMTVLMKTDYSVENTGFLATYQIMPNQGTGQNDIGVSFSRKTMSNQKLSF